MIEWNCDCFEMHNYASSHHSLLSIVHNLYYESSLYLSSHRRHSHRTLSTPFFRWDRACDGRLRNTQVSPRQSYKRRILEILFPMRPPTRCSTLCLYRPGIPYPQYKPIASDRHHRWDPRRSRYQYGKLMYERTCCVWYRSSLSQVSHSYSRIRLEWHGASCKGLGANAKDQLADAVPGRRAAAGGKAQTL